MNWYQTFCSFYTPHAQCKLLALAWNYAATDTTGLQQHLLQRMLSPNDVFLAMDAYSVPFPGTLIAGGDVDLLLI